MPDASIDVAAEALARRLLKDLPGRQPVARAAVDRLPPAVAGLLHARLNARVDREATLPMTPWVDYDHASARDAQATWREAARASAQIPPDAWEDMLAEASQLAVAHLAQPARTLSATVFADEQKDDDLELAAPEPLPTPLVLDRLRAFGPYPYLIEIVERYVDKKGLGHIDRDGLERLLLRIDSRMVAGFSADEWVDLLDPLFELLGGRAPADLLRLAFEARDQSALSDGLAGDAMTRAALRAHLETALTPAEAPSHEASVPQLDAEPPVADVAPEAPPEPEISPEPEATPDPEPTPATDELAPEDRPVERTTLAHAFEVELRRPSPPVIGSKFNAPEEVAPDDSDVLGPARPVEIVEAMEPMVSLDEPTGSITDAVVTETLEGATASDDEPLWKRLAGPQGARPAPQAADSEAATPLWAQFSKEPPAASPTPAPTPPARAPELRAQASLDTLELAVLGASDTDRRAWYTEELFSGNATDYETTLRQLDAARTWTEATGIIARDVFRKHSVNIYSDPAVTFTDAVEAQMEAR